MSNNMVIISVIVLALSSTTKAQSSRYYKGSLASVEVKDSTLLAIIDSLVDFEKRCDYYKPDLLFSVFLNMDSTIQIGSMDDKISESKVNLGCFTHHGHLFIVGGRVLNTTLFAVTNKKKMITYYKPSQDDMPIEDDSYTDWVYKHINGKFILVEYHTFCK